MIKRIIAVLMLAFLLCGSASAVTTTLTVGVYDATDSNKPIESASVLLSSVIGTLSTQNTVADGTVSFSVDYESAYTVSVVKEGYVSQSKSVAIKNPSGTEVALYLSQESPVAVKVTDSDGNAINDAVVVVDGKQIGSTNSLGLVHAPMKREAYHTISVSAISYETYSESNYIESDQTTVSVVLRKSKLTPIVYIYNENKNPVSGAAVYIDNVLVSYSDSYGRAQPLLTYTTGTYTLKVVKEGYQNYESTVILTADTTDIRVDLKYTTVPVTVNVLADKKPIASAVVYFDEKTKGVTDSYGNFVSNELPGTKITITASQDGYTAETVTYTVLADAENKVTINLTQNVPTTLIGVVALGVIIVLLILILVFTSKSRKEKKASKPKIPRSGGGRDSL